jgi:hypothetical protein
VFFGERVGSIASSTGASSTTASPVGVWLTSSFDGPQLVNEAKSSRQQIDKGKILKGLHRSHVPVAMVKRLPVEAAMKRFETDRGQCRLM